MNIITSSMQSMFGASAAVLLIQDIIIVTVQLTIGMRCCLHIQLLILIFKKDRKVEICLGSPVMCKFDLYKINVVTL